MLSGDENRRPIRKTAEDATVAGATADVRQVQRLTRVALLSALALVLGFVETLLPLSFAVPGIKLGLANAAILVALYVLDVRSAFYVAVVKVLAAGFLFGSPMMLAYSAGGTLLAFVAMAGLSRIRGLSVVPISMIAAILHNVGQLAVASVMLHNVAVWLTLPVLAVAACVTGLLVGFVVQGVLGSLASDERGQPIEAGEAALVGVFWGDTGVDDATGGRSALPFGVYQPGDTTMHRLHPATKIIAVTLYMLAGMVTTGIYSLWVLIVSTIVIAGWAHLGVRQIAKTFNPFWPFLVFVFLFDLFFGGGSFGITEQSVGLALANVIRFSCMLVTTSVLMLTTSPLELASGARSLLGPWRRLTGRGESLSMALGLTFRFVPLLADEFLRLKEERASVEEADAGGLKGRLSAYVPILSELFSRALQRADDLAVALVEQGDFSLDGDLAADGGKASTHETQHFWDYDIVCLLLAVVCLAMAVLL